MAKKSKRSKKASKTKAAGSSRQSGAGTGKHGAAVGRRWSGYVTKHSNALDFQKGVFTSKNPARIAASLKRSAETSKRRKADPYRSALSMLIFYRNRAGKNLPHTQKRVLDRAKAELRKVFGRQ